MGLFNDHVAEHRTSWTYKYKASVLLEKAKNLLERNARKEQDARNKSADLLRDTSVSQNDSRFAELKREIAAYGSLKEQLEVFVHEFARDPDRELQLGLGDVTFFELNKT